MIKVHYFPHRFTPDQRGGHEWGCDYEFRKCVEYGDIDEFKIFRRYDFDSGKFNHADIIYVYNIGTTIKNPLILEEYNHSEFPKFVGGIHGEDSFTNAKPFLQYFDAIHVANNNLYERVSKLHPNVYTLGSGVDIFEYTFKSYPIEFTIGWVGSEADPIKNFDIIKHLRYPKKIASKEHFIPREQMPNFYNNISVLVMPSDSEGCNMAILEACASSRPVISSDTGVVRDILDQEWIINIQPSKRQPFTRNLKEKLGILMDDKDLMRKVGFRNRIKVRKYSYSLVIPKLENIWYDVMTL